MEVLAPAELGSPDFRLNSSATAPASPRLFGAPFDYQFHYTSAPTSPSRAAGIYSHFSAYDNNDDSGELFDFAFDSGRISASLQLTEISTADELFEKGKIRPLQLPSAERGRQRSTSSASPRNVSRGSRSQSPLRDHGAFIKSTATNTAPSLPKSSGGSESRKWRLKDLLLFRSASEGRATGRESRDPLRKYALFPSFLSSTPTGKKKAGSSDESNKSFRSAESIGGSSRRGGGPVTSAHELHYTANRAAAEELRKKTPLAYQRQGIFGFIQYNPAIRSITKGFSG